MERFYESFSKLAQKKVYDIGLDLDRDSKQIDSQFLNSRPEAEPLIGIIPMTGKGIEANVDDLSFVNK